MPEEGTPVAVLFADISGSTSLYARLGDRVARGIVEAFMLRCTVLANDHGGRLVKTVGDAALCTFASADAAVLAASAIQADAAVSSFDGHSVRVHIGLHFGSVVRDHGDVYGDTVNLSAYLTDMAAPEQILTTDQTYRQLSDPLKACSRSIFRARVKGSAREIAIYQVLWKTDRKEITDVNLDSQRLLPEDSGGMMVAWRNRAIRLDHLRPSILIGRSAKCDVVVETRFASREHALIRIEGTDFFLVDRSINGTLVEFDDGREVHLLRRELLLDGAGAIWTGQKSETWSDDMIRFSRDRRSLYRT